MMHQYHFCDQLVLLEFRLQRLLREHTEAAGKVVCEILGGGVQTKMNWRILLLVWYSGYFSGSKFRAIQFYVVCETFLTCGVRNL